MIINAHQAAEKTRRGEIQKRAEEWEAERQFRNERLVEVLNLISRKIEKAASEGEDVLYVNYTSLDVEKQFLHIIAKELNALDYKAKLNSSYLKVYWGVESTELQTPEKESLWRKIAFFFEGDSDGRPLR